MAVSISAEVPAESGKSFVSDPEGVVWLFLAYTDLGRELKHQVKQKTCTKRKTTFSIMKKNKPQFYILLWTDTTEVRLTRSSLHLPEVRGQATMTYSGRDGKRGYLQRITAWWVVGT